MIFHIDRLNEHGLDILRIENKSERSFVSILPGFGGLLHSFGLAIDGSTHNVIDNYPDDNAVIDFLGASFKGAKLSPFPCRVPQGSYKFKGKRYELRPNFPDGSAIHGLLYNRPFEVVEASASSASVLLHYHFENEEPGYPFIYTCEIRYSLHPGPVLELATTVINNDRQEIPMADGWHPYFTLGGIADGYLLQINSTGMIEFNQDLVPTGKILKDLSFTMQSVVGDRELDNAFLVRPGFEQPACTLTNRDNNLQLQIFSNENYPYLLVYIPPDRKSIALENLSAAPNCFNNGMGLLVMQPGESRTFITRYKLSIV